MRISPLSEKFDSSKIFFVNIGYADSLGSGVWNLYKYTKIYSDAEPDFEEEDVFRLDVPRQSAGAMLTSGKKAARLQMLQKDNSRWCTGMLIFSS